jgi:hypothetical protein
MQARAFHASMRTGAHSCRCLPAATLMKERRLQQDSSWENLVQPRALRAPAPPAQRSSPTHGCQRTSTDAEGRPHHNTVHSATTQVSGHGSHPTQGLSGPIWQWTQFLRRVGNWYKMTYQHTCVLGRCQPSTSCARCSAPQSRTQTRPGSRICLLHACRLGHCSRKSHNR